MDWVVVGFAGVIGRPPSQDELARLPAALDAAPERFWPVYRQARADYDRGVVDAAGFWGEVCGLLGRVATLRMLDTLLALDLDVWSHVDRDMIGVATEIAGRGLPVALLSDASVELARHLDAQSWSGLFAHRFFSADLRRLLPDPEIFRLVCEKLGALPADVLLIDADARVIDAARTAGLATLACTTPDRLRADLATLLPSPAQRRPAARTRRIRPLPTPKDAPGLLT
ncbi:hypothetical protein Misp01_04980 [Microtetraspora sp. NBRC 13810]|uniref:HAD family hydrolase n=1 Tax=Microtetraspora sp. NBRC 13810 TaxID=3030990 RepID=UPI0024A59BCE|nr:HAD family hydrolase [Microtetraspora sp. NBRC 13810]GLW05368.1 hypothetical protein Misp01_04980 [Microtetraspora sp. NBRC 13810]